MSYCTSAAAQKAVADVGVGGKRDVPKQGQSPGLLTRGGRYSMNTTSI